MMLVVGFASALSAFASLPRWRISTFLTILSDLFAFETILFGLADIVALLGYWPQAYADYELPRYLPLATALFGVAIFGISHFPFVRRMMAITDPFFEAQTPISIRPWPLPPMALRQSLYGRINVFFLILINQFQVALGVRLNFFYRAFGNAIQVPDAVHSGAVLAAVALGVHAAGRDLDRGVPRRVLRLAEFRAAVAALDDRVLYVALAPAFDALQDGAPRRPHRQPGPAHLRGRRRLHQRRRRRRRLRERRRLQLHDPGDDHRDQSGGVLDHPVGNFAKHGHLGVRGADSRISVLGRHPLRLLRHRHDASDRPHAVAAHVPPAGGRGELPFRPGAHPRIQRADRPAQGRTAGDRPRRQRVQRRLSSPSSGSSACGRC